MTERLEEIDLLRVRDAQARQELAAHRALAARAQAEQLAREAAEVAARAGATLREVWTRYGLDHERDTVHTETGEIQRGALAPEPAEPAAPEPPGRAAPRRSPRSR